MEREIIELLVKGGKASPDASTAQKLSALKLNVQEIFNQINERTKDYGGIEVPIKMEIDRESGEYTIQIGIPPISALIKKELGIEKAKIQEAGEGEKKEGGREEKSTTGNLSMEQVVKIAKIKREDLLAKDLRGAVKQVLGTTVSMMGITIEEKPPKEILQEVKEGKWDHLFE